jgi:integrase
MPRIRCRREGRRGGRRPGSATGCWPTPPGRPAARSALRLREPRRLPRALDRREAAELLASFRTWRDRAIAGLMLYCGLRSAEVLGLDVTDADIAGMNAHISHDLPLAMVSTCAALAASTALASRMLLVAA